MTVDFKRLRRNLNRSIIGTFAIAVVIIIGLGIVHKLYDSKDFHIRTDYDRLENEKYVVCDYKSIKSSNGPSVSIEKRLFMITPTYERSEQFAELTRMIHMLKSIKERGQIHWILVEDASVCSKKVIDLIQNHFHDNVS